MNPTASKINPFPVALGRRMVCCVATIESYFRGIFRDCESCMTLRAALAAILKHYDGTNLLMSGPIRKLAGVAFLIGAVAPLLAGCDEPNTATASTTVEAPEVSIVKVEPQPRALIRELPGRIAPTRISEVRARVAGIITKRMFNQGSEVNEGDPLYQIDPEPFKVELMASEAALAKADAAFEVASRQAERIETLAKQLAVSTAEKEKAIGALRQAQAEIAGRKADVARARLNLDYATIRAPISGIVGAALVSEGALVVQNDNTNLATIQQLDPIYADFTQSVTEMTKLRRAIEKGDLEKISGSTTAVRLVLDDGSIYPHEGKLLFSEVKVDTYTGQVTLRGQFPNPKKELLPGMYVRVQIEQGLDADAITVPQQAVQRNGAGGSEVFVVKDDGRVAIQTVRVGTNHDGSSIILDGLKSGDSVVVEGFQKFAPGDKVVPLPWQQAQAAPPASPAAQTR